MVKNEIIKAISKEEMLKIKNKNYRSYYCKDDICVEHCFNYNEHTIEIPNKNRTLNSHVHLITLN